MEHVNQPNHVGATGAIVAVRDEQRLKVYKIVKTIFMANIWLCLGLWVSVISPCIDAMKSHVHSNYEQIASAFACKSIGKMVGSLLGGYLADKYQRWNDFQLGMLLLFGGISYGTIPWAPNVAVMGISFFVNGLATGGISAGGNSHTIILWGKDASGPFHFIHAGFGIGRIIGPLIVAPFLLTTGHNSTRNGTTHNSFLSDEVYQQPYVDSEMFYAKNDLGMFQNYYKHQGNSSTDDDVNVSIPFAIAGGYSCLIAMVFFIYACFPFTRFQLFGSESNINSDISNLQNQENYIQNRSTHTQNRETLIQNDITHDQNESAYRSKNAESANRQNQNKSFKEIFSPGSCANGDTYYALQMFSMIFLFYVLMVGRNVCVIGFLQPVAVHTPTLNFTLREADTLITVFFICFTFGRVVISMVSKLLPIQVVIFAECLSILASTIGLVVFGLKSKLNFWITLCFFAFCNGPIYPSGMAWSNQYLKMTATAFAFLDIGIACGAFIFNWLTGYILTKYPSNPIILYYLALGTSVISLLLLTLMQIKGYLHGDMDSQLPVRDIDHNEDDDGIEDDVSPLIQS